MRSCGSPLIQYDWCPYKRKLEHKNWDDDEKKRGEDGHFLAMEERPQKKLALLTP